jgi:hypothetical protein
MIISLLIALVWLTRVRDQHALVERFIVPPGTTLPGGFQIPDVDLQNLPEPHKLFEKARELINKYDKPDVWLHAAQMMDKDPGQLARLQLGIQN